MLTVLCITRIPNVLSSWFKLSNMREASRDPRIKLSMWCKLSNMTDTQEIQEINLNMMIIIVYKVTVWAVQCQRNLYLEVMDYSIDMRDNITGTEIIKKKANHILEQGMKLSRKRFNQEIQQYVLDMSVCVCWRVCSIKIWKEHAPCKITFLSAVEC